MSTTPYPSTDRAGVPCLPVGATPAGQQTPRYQVGNLMEIDPRDPHYPDRAQAVARALQRSAQWPASSFGIWQAPEQGAQLVAIAYAGELFWKHSPDETERIHD